MSVDPLNLWRLRGLSGSYRIRYSPDQTVSGKRAIRDRLVTISGMMSRDNIVAFVAWEKSRSVCMST